MRIFGAVRGPCGRSTRTAFSPRSAPTGVRGGAIRAVGRTWVPCPRGKMGRIVGRMRGSCVARSWLRVLPLTLKILCALLILLAAAPALAAREALRSGTRPPRPFANICSSSPHLSYYGGQVIQNVNIVSVFWTANVDPAVVQYIPTFYSDITTSGYLGWLSEYDTLGVLPVDGGLNTLQGINTGVFAGAYTITPSVCGTSAACTLDDSQIGAELAAQITAGNLPSPVISCDGLHVDSIYMFEFPANVTITTGGETVCSQLCAYHFFTTINGRIVPYGVHPDFAQQPCTGICAPHANVSGRSYFDDVTSVHTHELAEAITDMNYTGDVRPSAWIDPNNDTGNCAVGEIGDICSYQESLVTMSSTSQYSWYVQQLWSNVAGDCITTRTAAPVCTGSNTPPGCRRCRCSDNLATVDGCPSATPWCETNLSNVKWGDCVQCTNSVDCTSTQICENSTTASQDDVCVACGNAGEPCCSGSVCVAPNTCGGGGVASQCGCTPTTCAALGLGCGTLPDGCGNTLNCGTCTAPDTCGGAQSGQCGCTPETCAQLGANCGSISDGCFTMLNCGTCTAPNACGGGAQPNQCGCMPKTCAQLGADCGGVSDGCFTTLNCGTCMAPRTCGLTQPNQCGCKSKTCSDLGFGCGSALDGCGNTISCGNCGSGQSCESNQCSSPGTDAGLPPDAGSRADGGPGGSDAGTSNSGFGPTGSSSGCGCRLVSASPASGGISMVAVALLLGIRRRRRLTDTRACGPFQLSPKPTPPASLRVVPPRLHDDQ